MDFYDVLDKVQVLLSQRGRVSYRALQRQFALVDEDLEALKDELIYAKRLAVDEDGRVLVWVGEAAAPSPLYFGYPLAHEDDAQRAVRAGLGIIEALEQLNTRLAQEGRVPLAARLGIHTGLVVVGEVGGGTRQEQLALGETPNLAARLQGSATPNTLVISAATYQLLGGFFACQSLGTQLLRGLPQPLEVYQVLYENMASSRLEAASSTGLTPLVGRFKHSVRFAHTGRGAKEDLEFPADLLGLFLLDTGEQGVGVGLAMPTTEVC